MITAKIAVAAIIVSLCVLELRDGQFRRGWTDDPARRARNLWFLAASLAVMAVLTPVGEALRESLPPLRRWQGDGWLEVLLCTLTAELCGWTLHYVKHRHPFLWRFHFQHHRESHYNIWLSTHTHALEVIVSGALTAAALCLLGFSPFAAGTYLLLYSFAKVYQHSARDYSLGLLDRVLVGPRYHRLHHCKDSRCNYGTVVTLFDVLFRTARWPAAAAPEAEYGVAGELPFGFWPEMTSFVHRPAPAVPNPGPANAGTTRVERSVP
jgi:sterol desaturase/sphingolipid hydroxylase (fatty acid hydroxylase superfamily)